MIKPFCMVIAEDGESTSARHYSTEEAVTEADRLVKKENKVFYVLRVIGAFGPVKNPVERKELKEENGLK